MRLNLGCCDRHLDGYTNVDICPPADELVDLSQPWPWADNSVDEIFAADIFEHLPDIRHTMNEAWRVLKPGAVLHLVVPTTDGRGAWQDPTHCSWWNPNTLFYFTAGNPHRERFGAHYGVHARFAIREQRHEELRDKVWKLTAKLEAVK